MADLPNGENPKQQGESLEQRKGKVKRKVMESGFDKSGNASEGRRGRPSLGRTQEEKRLLKNESDRKYRAKHRAEFLRLQAREEEERYTKMVKSMEGMKETIKNVMAENTELKKSTNMLWEVMSKDNKVSELPDGFFDGLVLPNVQELEDIWYSNPPGLEENRSPNAVINAGASTSTATHHTNEEIQALKNQIMKELKHQMEEEVKALKKHKDEEVEAFKKQMKEEVQEAVKSQLRRAFSKD